MRTFIITYVEDNLRFTYQYYGMNVLEALEQLMEENLDIDNVRSVEEVDY